MQDRNQGGTGKHTAGPNRNPNPAGAPRDPASDPARTRGAGTTHGVGAAPGAPGTRDTVGARDTVGTRETVGARDTRDTRGARTTPGARGAPYDPKDAGATGHHAGARTPVSGDREAPGAGSDFVKRSGTWRTMKSWQPWVLIGAAVVLVIIGLMVL
jgi:hypothetical protein